VKNSENVEEGIEEYVRRKQKIGKKRSRDGIHEQFGNPNIPEFLGFRKRRIDRCPD
jgi:hypothetical protein